MWKSERTSFQFVDRGVTVAHARQCKVSDCARCIWTKYAHCWSTRRELRVIDSTNKDLGCWVTVDEESGGIGCSICKAAGNTVDWAQCKIGLREKPRAKIKPCKKVRSRHVMVQQFVRHGAQ